MATDLASRNLDAKISFNLGVLEEQLRAAMTKHRPMASHHEAYAVMLEELDEYWEEVKKWPHANDNYHMRVELYHVAAMALRTIIDLDL